MQLDAGNTAVILDSTADFPEGPERWPNWRVVPLYVRFGADSYRDYVDLGPADFYARLREATERCSRAAAVCATPHDRLTRQFKQTVD